MDSTATPMSNGEILDFLRKASHDNLTALKFLWAARTANGHDLEGHDCGYFVAQLGMLAAHLTPALPVFQECFALLARVSRRPFGNLMFTASSTTEYVIRLGIAFAEAVDAAIRDRSVRTQELLSSEERECYRKAWPALREPLSNSGMLPTYGKCLELEAEVDWEFHRAEGLLPPEQKRLLVSNGMLELFFSYAHKDEKLRDKLATHLSQLKHEGLIGDWHDRKITAGTEWEGKIDEHLSSAQIILLLVSSDFLASRYIHDVEVTRALQRHSAGEARVIPVILRSCDWHSAPFGKLQALPPDGKPITKWKDRDEAFTLVAKGIRAVVKELENTAGANPVS